MLFLDVVSILPPSLMDLHALMSSKYSLHFPAPTLKLLSLAAFGLQNPMQNIGIPLSLQQLLGELSASDIVERSCGFLVNKLFIDASSRFLLVS